VPKRSFGVTKRRRDKLVLLSRHTKVIIERSSGYVKIEVGPMGQNNKIHAVPIATGYFMILSFSHVSFKQSPMFCLAMEQAMSQSTTFCAGNAAMCFLPYVLRSERTETAVRSSEGYVLRSQVNRICVGERRRTLRNVRNAACQRTWRRQQMRDAGLAQIGIFCKNMCFP